MLRLCWLHNTIRHVISQSAIKMLISDNISRLYQRGVGYCKGKATNVQEVAGVYRISLILFDVREGDDCCTSCVSIIIKQKDFVTFPVSGSARRRPLVKRLIPLHPHPSGPPQDLLCLLTSVCRVHNLAHW